LQRRRLDFVNLVPQQVQFPLERGLARGEFRMLASSPLSVAYCAA